MNSRIPRSAPPPSARASERPAASAQIVAAIVSLAVAVGLVAILAQQASESEGLPKWPQVERATPALAAHVDGPGACPQESYLYIVGSEVERLFVLEQLQNEASMRQRAGVSPRATSVVVAMTDDEESQLIAESAAGSTTAITGGGTFVLTMSLRRVAR